MRSITFPSLPGAPRCWYPRTAHAALIASALLAAASAAAVLPHQSPGPGRHAANGHPPAGESAPEWQGIQRQISTHQHRFVAQPDGSVLANSPVQGWQARFDGRGGVWVKDDSAAQPWQMHLQLQGVGYGQSLQAPGAQPAMTVQGEYSERLHYRWSDHLTEWWTNGAQGMEQWFQLTQPPARVQGQPADAPLTLQLTLQGDYRAQGQGHQLVLTPRNESAKLPALRYHKLQAWDANGRDVPGQMRAEGGHIVLALDDRQARYPITIDPVLAQQQAYLKASGALSGANFGSAVAASGDTVVVGAPEPAYAVGLVYVFVRSGSGWSQQATLFAPNAQAGDRFGSSVAISGDTVVVGATGEDSNATGVNGDQANNSASESGAAYVFTRSGSSWSHQAYLKASNTDADDHFGRSVAISGDTVVVGADGEDSNATSVDGDQTNNSAGSAGAAYVFARSGSSWSQQAYLKASDAGADDGFGWATAIAADTVVVGPYVFTRSGSTWSEQAKLTAAGADWFRAVAISSDTVVLGSSLMSATGGAYVFTRSGTSWSQQGSLYASNAQPSDHFGSSVAISGDTVVVGADSEASNAIGVDGDQTNNGAPNAGAAYVFTRSGGTWVQQAYLKASNTEPGDYFGGAVAISGHTVVVGAYREDSAATGVNGHQADNTTSDAGAAYVFDLNNNALTLTGAPGVGQVGAPYAFTPLLGPVGATMPVTFSVALGTLPPGLVLDPATGAVTGTPSTAGSYPVTLRVTNPDGSADLPVTLVVTAAATPVPTLSQWAMAALGLLMSGVCMRRRRLAP